MAEPIEPGGSNIIDGTTAALRACLSEDELLAFAEGTLSADALTRAHGHLDGCALCQRLLSEAAHALAESSTFPISVSEDPPWNTMFQPGAVVGKRYVIRRFIARGGMGEVYEAFDRELFERVALKTVASTASDNPNAVKRLKAEVQLARRVSHPNVSRIYEFGAHVKEATKTQIHFLTMEYVEGETLGQRVRLGGALPVEECLAIARQLLNGLSAAHAAEILHRDFKSDNVMLRSELDGRTTPVILDFGLAGALEKETSQRTSAARTVVGGTFGYMAPEQIEGKALTRSSDIYSFGIVWFEMLTGTSPFNEGPSLLSNPVERVRARTVEAPSRMNSELPPGLDPIVLRCVRAAPSARFQTVGEVLEALDAFERSHGRRALPLPRAVLAAAAGLVLGGALSYAIIPREPRRPGEQVVRSVHSASLRDAHLAPAMVPPPTPPATSAPTHEASVDHKSHSSHVATRGRNAAHLLPRNRSTPPVPTTAAPASASVGAPTEPVVEPSSSDSVLPVRDDAVAPPPSRVPGPVPAPGVVPKKPDWEDPFGTGPAEVVSRGRKKA